MSAFQDESAEHTSAHSKIIQTRILHFLTDAGGQASGAAIQKGVVGKAQSIFAELKGMITSGLLDSYGAGTKASPKVYKLRSNAGLEDKPIAIADREASNSDPLAIICDGHFEEIVELFRTLRICP